MNNDQKELVNFTASWVKDELSGAEGGHDWWHTYRVWKTASKIATEESANEFIVQLASLLHDIADSKFYDGNEDIGPEKARKFLHEAGVDDKVINEVILIIINMSFKNSFDVTTYKSTELNVVMDADRLDAIGAIGITRTFNYGGYKGSEIYNPDIPPQKYNSKDEYKKSNAPTINHFYEKLLLLKNMMTTETGKRLAIDRHSYMEEFLDRFFAEWEGKL